MNPIEDFIRLNLTLAEAAQALGKTDEERLYRERARYWLAQTGVGTT